MAESISKSQRVAVQALAEKIDEDWTVDCDDYECPACATFLHLRKEMEPRGLCDSCLHKVASSVPAYEAALVEAEAVVQSISRRGVEIFNELTAQRDTLAAKLAAMTSARDGACDRLCGIMDADHGWNIYRGDELRFRAVGAEK